MEKTKSQKASSLTSVASGRLDRRSATITREEFDQLLLLRYPVNLVIWVQHLGRDLFLKLQKSRIWNRVKFILKRIYQLILILWRQLKMVGFGGQGY